MKIQPECIPCLMKRCLYEIELVNKDITLSKEVLIKAMETLVKEFDSNKCSATIATRVHKVVYDGLGVKDLYKEVKRRSNEVALSLIPKIEERIKRSKDPLKSAIISAIIGNTLDFGIEGGSRDPNDLVRAFDSYFKEGLGYSDYDIFREILSKAKKALFIADNCGEIVFDRILCREIKRFYPDVELILVVRGEPILSDATREDAKMLKFEEVVDGILDTGTFAVGLDLDNIPKELQKNLQEADIVICKGMANYEVFSELNYKPIAYLLRTKCNAVARSMGLKSGINALKVYL